MKGFAALFIVLAGLGIAWRYTPRSHRKALGKALADNILTITIVLCALTVFLFLSLNITMRFI